MPILLKPFPVAVPQQIDPLASHLLHGQDLATNMVATR
jgi:hypothetical protein